jgi:2,3-bisphosphoglycerate-dependent phosphoglycerate mutase
MQKSQTGWADIGLTQQGKDQAVAAGRAVKLAVKKGILPSKEIEANDSIGVRKRLEVPAIDVAFCSLLKRATDTMNLILNEVHLAVPLDKHKSSSDECVDYQYHIPIIQSWRLNERHYGALVGLSKEGAERIYGKVRLSRWRDSWDVPPPPMPLQMLKKWDQQAHCQPVTIVNRGKTAAHRDVDDYASRASCVKILEHTGKKERSEIENETTITNDPNDQTLQTFMPPSESLCNTYERFMPLWLQGITPHLRAGRTVLVVGHANTIRSMLFAIDPDIVTKENSKQVKIPSALPLVYEFVDAHQSRMLGTIHGDAKEAINGFQEGKVYIDGKECSKVVPGNLRVIKPRRHSTSLNSQPTANEVIYSDQTNISKKEMKYSLNGVWVETEETKSVSFCTEAGRQAGEQDIA